MQVVSDSMSALARTTKTDCDTRAANEDCINGGSRTRTKFDYAYNATTGLLTTLTYPKSASPSTYRLTAGYAYANGILQQIYDSSTPSTIWWQANTTNARGQITQETTEDLSGHPQIVSSRVYDAVTGWLGSTQTGLSGGSALQNEAYVHDYVGNVTQRQNNNAGLTENFYYDKLYRLYYSTLGGATNLQMCYDNTGGACTENLPGMGNITSRSDIAGGAAWTYDPARKHAVTQAGSGSYTYAYDANGNANSRNGTTFGWTSYNYPSSVGTSTETATFDYGPTRARWRMVYSGPSGIETTYYTTPLFEQVVTSSGTDYRHYIYAGGRPVMVISRTTAGAINVHSLLVDHKGSIATIMTDATGAADVAESFTAFGNRREASTWAGAPTSTELATMNGVTRQGYTFQTVLGSMGLNHMNGRVEDAVTGRFISPDPYVPSPSNTQSYNRYTYVNNNPLSDTDPSGFFNLGNLLNPFSNSNPLNPFGSFGRKLALSPFTTQYSLFRFGQRQGDSMLRDYSWLQPIAEVAACYYGGPYACAAADAYLTRLNGGTIDQALIAGAVTFASGQLSTGVDEYLNVPAWGGGYQVNAMADAALAHGAIQGVASSLTGGTFWRSFELGAGGSLLTSAYEYFALHAPGWGSGEARPDGGVCGESDSSCYNPTANGHVPEAYYDVNTFGNNIALGGSGDCFYQSGACSNFLDQVPGLQAVSQLHDNWMINLPGGFNFPSMPFAAALSYSALIGGSYYLAPYLNARH